MYRDRLYTTPVHIFRNYSKSVTSTVGNKMSRVNKETHLAKKLTKSGLEITDVQEALKPL
jgi:hypothetical protein